MLLIIARQPKRPLKTGAYFDDIGNGFQMARFKIIVTFFGAIGVTINCRALMRGAPPGRPSAYPHYQPPRPAGRLHCLRRSTSITKRVFAG